jgi:hypothetical protein
MLPGMPRISAQVTGGICTRAVLYCIGSGKAGGDGSGGFPSKGYDAYAQRFY